MSTKRLTLVLCSSRGYLQAHFQRARQERNATRVVEQAVKSEVPNTVLPVLENITENGIKAA